MHKNNFDPLKPTVWITHIQNIAKPTLVIRTTSLFMNLILKHLVRHGGLKDR